MGQFGRITTKADLPNDKALAAMVKQAVALNAAGKKKAPAKKASRKPRPVVVPAALLAGLNKNKKARAAFEGMSPNHLSRAGWSKRSLTPGETIDLTYYKLRDGRHGGFNVTVTRANGTQLRQLPGAPITTPARQ